MPAYSNRPGYIISIACAQTAGLIQPWRKGKKYFKAVKNIRTHINPIRNAGFWRNQFLCCVTAKRTIYRNRMALANIKF